MFREGKTKEIEAEIGLERGCRDLGFQMDCGKAFQEKYGEQAFYHAEALETIADEIDDEMLLGSAIYSKWRYITHWSQQSLLSEENRKWFQSAFYRLSVLTGEDWKKSWSRQAQKENPLLQQVMMKTLEDYLNLHPEG